LTSFAVLLLLNNLLNFTTQALWGMHPACGTDEQLVYDDAVYSSALGRPTFVVTTTICSDRKSRFGDAATYMMMVTVSVCSDCDCHVAAQWSFHSMPCNDDDDDDDCNCHDSGATYMLTSAVSGAHADGE
jgi:hypothetical protein